MNKKIMIVLFSFLLLQAPTATAGFFSSFSKELAAIGLAFAKIFKSKGSSSASSEESQDFGSSTSTLAEDPNDYPAHARVALEPTNAECIPRSSEHRCSYLESDQVIANTCVNQVPVKSSIKNKVSTER